MVKSFSIQLPNDLQLNRRAAPRRFEAGVHDHLRFQGAFRPLGIQYAGTDLVRKIADHIRGLRILQTLGVFSPATAASDADFFLFQFKRRLVVAGWMDKIWNDERA